MAKVARKKRGENSGMKGAKLLRRNGEEMSTFRLSIMLMKTNDLHQALHHVDENKGERRWRRG